MKIATKIMAASAVLAVLVFSGCKKGETGPKGETGAQGPQGPVVNMTNAGYITGTLTGTRRDGTPFSEPFSYTYYFPGNSGSGTLDSLNATNYIFDVQRQEADIFSNNYCDVKVVTSSKTATSGTVTISMQFEKTLGATKYFTFSGGSNSSAITGLSYNTSTGLFSGTFTTSISGNNNNTGNNATVTASFQASLVQKVYLQHKDAMIKND